MRYHYDLNGFDLGFLEEKSLQELFEDPQDELLAEVILFFRGHCLIDIE